MWGYKWEGIYSRRTNQSKTNNMLRGKLMKPVLLQLFFLSLWEHEPQCTAEKTNTGSTEFIAWCFIAMANARSTVCAQLNLLKLNID